MAIKSPNGAEKHCKNLKPEVPKVPKSVLFLHKGSSKLCDSHTFLHKTAAFYNDQCMTHHFFTTLKSHKWLETTHSRTMALFTTLFSSFVCMSMKHLLWSLTLLSDQLSLEEWRPPDYTLTTGCNWTYSWSINFTQTS